MRTSPAIDDYSTVRLTLSEWASVIAALEKQGWSDLADHVVRLVQEP